MIYLQFLIYKEATFLALILSQISHIAIKTLNGSLSINLK